MFHVFMFHLCMFLNLTMLAGIAGALLPLVVHLLSRSRYRTVDWGAMMFLQGAEARTLQGARIKQWAILLLRMTLIASLAMALSRPVMRGRWGGLGRDARVNAVIVLDCSASMQFDENGKTRMELARSAVLNVLESLKENSVAIVLMGAHDPESSPLAEPTTDLQQLAQRVLSLPEPSGRADLRPALERAMDILDRGTEAGRELYVVCDRQSSNWKDVNSEAFRQNWQARTTKAGGPTRLVVIPVGSEKSENLAIESVELINPPAVRDQPAEVEVQIRNFGQTARGNVDLKVEDKVLTVSVAPDSVTTVRAPLRFYQPGSKVVTATLTGTGLKFDDRMQAAVDVVEPIRVLIVSGDERGIPLQNESDFLRIALAPKAAEARQKGDGSESKIRGDLCKVQVEPFDRWNQEDLRDYSVVVLANVPQLSAAQALALEQFVYEGGGLWVAPGNLTRVESYNALLYHDGNGILPVKLQPATAEDGSEATTLQGVTNFDHPIFRFLKGRPDPIPLVTIGRYFPADVRDRDAQVLAQYASGRPFLIEAPAGRGRVLVMTTALDADWGTLPLSNFYLPFVQSAARYLASGPDSERNLAPGSPLVAQFGPGADVREARVRLPSGEFRPLPVTRGEVRYSRTSQPGIYTFFVNGTMPDWMKRVDFVIRTPSAESDLTPLSPAQWQEFSHTLGFERIDPARESVVAAVSAARSGHELWLSLVGVVIVLGILEMAVVRRWSGGAR
jgi:hypothetical protein